MRLFIRVKDGQTFEHPIMEDNFHMAFPDVDMNNLPPEFVEFIRIAPPILGVYEKNQSVKYELIDGKYTDVFSCEQFTQEEKLAKQQQEKDNWTNSGMAAARPSWAFDESKCQFVPPTPDPSDETNKFAWSETKQDWVYIPPRPTVPGLWLFDIESGIWVKQ
jgi:hypothetical protein